VSKEVKHGTRFDFVVVGDPDSDSRGFVAIWFFPLGRATVSSIILADAVGEAQAMHLSHFIEFAISECSNGLA
jgi:hypothetical protein